MKKILMVLTVLLMTLPCLARDPLALSVVGNDDSIAVRLGITPGERSEVGCEILYADGLTKDIESAGFSAYSIFDVVKDLNVPMSLPFGMGQATVRATGYVGGKVGVIRNVDGKPNYDATGAALAGIRLGSEKASIGLEYQAIISENAWKVFADSDAHALMMVVRYVF